MKEILTRFVLSVIVYSIVLYNYGKWLIRKERNTIEHLKVELDLINEVHKMKQANIPVPEWIEKQIEEIGK